MTTTTTTTCVQLNGVSKIEPGALDFCLFINILSTVQIRSARRHAHAGPRGGLRRRVLSHAEDAFVVRFSSRPVYATPLLCVFAI